MARSKLQAGRKISIFTTAAGTGLGSLGLRGLLNLQLPNYLNHWGIIVARDEDDPQAIMVELNKGDRTTGDWRSSIHPLVRSRDIRAQEEARNFILNTVHTEFRTRLSDEAIRKAALKVCEKMGGRYDITKSNCHGFVSLLISMIHLGIDSRLTHTSFELLREMWPSSRHITERDQRLRDIEIWIAEKCRSMVDCVNCSSHNTASEEHRPLGGQVVMDFKRLLQDLRERLPSEV